MHKLRQTQAFKEACVIYLSLGFFVEILHLNDFNIDPRYIQLYKGVKHASQMYARHDETIIAHINKTVNSIPLEGEIDAMLASISVIAFYYEQLQGKRRIFAPMSHEHVLEIQCLHLDHNYDTEKRTLDFCEAVVFKLLA